MVAKRIGLSHQSCICTGWARALSTKKSFIGEIVLLGVNFNEAGEGLKWEGDWHALK